MKLEHVKKNTLENRRQAKIKLCTQKFNLKWILGKITKAKTIKQIGRKHRTTPLWPWDHKQCLDRTQKAITITLKKN